jgi:hypothetical protein
MRRIGFLWLSASAATVATSLRLVPVCRLACGQTKAKQATTATHREINAYVCCLLQKVKWFFVRSAIRLFDEVKRFTPKRPLRPRRGTGPA